MFLSTRNVTQKYHYYFVVATWADRAENHKAQFLSAMIIFNVSDIFPFRSVSRGFPGAGHEFHKPN
jgi:hypothetical protein